MAELAMLRQAVCWVQLAVPFLELGLVIRFQVAMAVGIAENGHVRLIANVHRLGRELVKINGMYMISAMVTASMRQHKMQ